MSYKKLTADFIFDGKQLLQQAVLIIDTDGTIIDCLSNADESVLNDAEYFTGILSPGFINAHCHVELSHLHKKIPEHIGLVDFLLYVIGQRSESIENIQQAAVEADRYMYEQGIVAVGDISNTDHTIPVKKNSKIYYHTFIETIGFNPATAEQQFNTSKALQQSFQQNNLSATIVPHAPYSVSEQLFQLINEDNASIISIHNQECGDENLFFEKKEGDFLRLYQSLNIPIDYFKPSRRTSLQTYYPWLKTPQNIILVHNVVISPEEIQMINSDKNHNVFFCICANANNYIQQQIPPIQYFSNTAIDKIIIGTDSLASNHQLSIIEELKTIQYYHPSIPLEKLLKWATYNGAKALQIEDRFGSFRKGLKPGIVQIRNCINENLKNAMIDPII